MMFYKWYINRNISYSIKLRLYVILFGSGLVFDGLITLLTFGIYGTRFNELIFWKLLVEEEVKQLKNKTK